MCGRYTLRTPVDVVADEFHARYEQSVLGFGPRFNIAPTQNVPVIRPRGGDGDDVAERSLSLMRWGLVPMWAKDLKIGASAINARAETVDQKPMFRDAFRRRRCLVPADGFYEWKGPRLPPGGKKPIKTPHFIHLKSDEVFTFAGIWETWRGPDGPVESCSLLTTSPNELMAELHDRMPVIIPRAAGDEWMSRDTEPGRLQELMSPYPADAMDAYVVSREVNSPKNERPELIEPAELSP